jgi:uncharacterized protein YciI
MGLFVLSCLDRQNGGELRAATRPAHLAYIAEHPGVVRLAGPYMDEDGQSVGSMFIVEAESKAAVEAFSAGDPYRRAGLFEAVEIRPWRVVVGALT